MWKKKKNYPPAVARAVGSILRAAPYQGATVVRTTARENGIEDSEPRGAVN
jgi:hypothetical protein